MTVGPVKPLLLSPSLFFSFFISLLMVTYLIVMCSDLKMANR